MSKNPQAQLDLAKSIITDIERNLFGRGLAVDKLAISQTLLDSDDAKHLLHPELVASLQERIDTLQEALIKQAQGDVGKLQSIKKK